MFQWSFWSLWLLLLFLPISSAMALSSNDLIRLHEAGIGPVTLELIVREKVIETCAFSVDELVQLKQAGLGDDALNRIIKEGSFMKDAGTVEYGESTRTLRNLGVHDIIKLKESGVSDEVIQTIVQNTGRDATDQDRERAWQMLDNMGIILDDRKFTPPPPAPLRKPH